MGTEYIKEVKLDDNVVWVGLVGEHLLRITRFEVPNALMVGHFSYGMQRLVDFVESTQEEIWEHLNLAMLEPKQRIFMLWQMDQIIKKGVK
jgi:hypothetical protein